MFDRFRQKYPQGSITSSLIQIHNDRYIVSVSIKVDGVILATTLAADEQIQVAEAQATAQAIQTLGIKEPLVNQTELDPVLPIAIPQTMTELPDFSLPAATEHLDMAVEPEPPTINNHKKAAIVQEDITAATYDVSSDDQPLSITDMIPLINMELKRLAWSREKGRDCIIELYNKRSSSLLSDEELLGLLRYLQAQTAPD